MITFEFIKIQFDIQEDIKLVKEYILFWLDKKFFSDSL